MADTTLSLTIKQTDANRVADAFDGLYGGRITTTTDVEGKPVVTSFTKQQWVKRQVMKFIKDTVKQYEAMVAANTARAEANKAGEADIS